MRVEQTQQLSRRTARFDLVPLVFIERPFAHPEQTPAARWLSRGFCRMRRIVAGEGTPSIRSFNTRSASSAAARRVMELTPRIVVTAGADSDMDGIQGRLVREAGFRVTHETPHLPSRRTNHRFAAEDPGTGRHRPGRAPTASTRMERHIDVVPKTPGGTRTAEQAFIAGG